MGPGSEIWINAFYSPKLTDDLIHNKVACTDKGTHLGIVEPTENDENGGGQVVDPAGGSTSSSVKVTVLTPQERESLITLASQKAVIVE